MFDNHIYDLLAQLTEEHKSLWRMKNMYREDSNCPDCKKLWEKLATQKEENIKEMQKILKAHIC